LFALREISNPVVSIRLPNINEMQFKILIGLTLSFSKSLPFNKLKKDPGLTKNRLSLVSLSVSASPICRLGCTRDESGALAARVPIPEADPICRLGCTRDVHGNLFARVAEPIAEPEADPICRLGCKRDDHGNLFARVPEPEPQPEPEAEPI
jgi:hypothetical protein